MPETEIWAERRARLAAETSDQRRARQLAEFEPDYVPHPDSVAASRV